MTPLYVETRGIASLGCFDAITQQARCIASYEHHVSTSHRREARNARQETLRDRVSTTMRSKIYILKIHIR
ncbi:MAG TPA: hypothetical protein ENF37_07995 [Beggiatoa sp.]|nr:hypothetical protein [Beggiatoa sp.]